MSHGDSGIISKRDVAVVRLEFLILGAALSVLGAMTFAFPNLIPLQSLGGVILGAGLTLVMTELYSISERKRHSQLLTKVAEVRELNTQLMAQRERDESAVFRRAFKVGEIIGQLYWRASNEDSDDAKNHVALEFYALTDSLGIPEAAKRAWSWIADAKEAEPNLFRSSEPGSHESTFAIILEALRLKYGSRTAQFFLAGMNLEEMKGVWISGAKPRDPSSGKEATEAFLSNLSNVERDSATVEYARTAFKELLLPNIPKENRQELLNIFSRYLSAFGLPKSDEFHQFFEKGLMPHDGETFFEECETVLRLGGFAEE